MGGANSAQCLVTVVSVLEEVLAVVMRHEQRWRVPPLLDAVLHGLDVGLPVLLGDGNNNLVPVGTSHRRESVERESHRTQVGSAAHGKGGGQRGVATARAGEEVDHPLGQPVLVRGVPGRGERELLLVTSRPSRSARRAHQGRNPFVTGVEVEAERIHEKRPDPSPAGANDVDGRHVTDVPDLVRVKAEEVEGQPRRSGDRAS